MPNEREREESWAAMADLARPEWEDDLMVEIDTLNKFLVSAHNDKIVIMMKLPIALSKEDALNLAAYLVCLSDQSECHRHFSEVLHSIENA